MRPLVLLLAAVALAGCAPRLAGEPVPRVRDVVVGSARFRILHGPEDARAAAQVARALEAALPRLERWGGLAAPVTVAIHPDHAHLERAVRREGYSWLRAWARYGRIDLQSPRTWRLLGASDADVAELVTHELAHCVMYQRAGDEHSWPFRGEPLWFREGLASVTAEQAYRRGTLEQLRRNWAAQRDADAAFPPAGEDGGAAAGDPIANPEPLYRRHADLVYDAAHHAFAYLLERHGEARVRRVIALMGSGRGFARAFEEAIGTGEPVFAAEFRRHVLGED